MVAKASEAEYRAVIRMRTKDARTKTGRSQEVMAGLLGVETPAYKKWENRRNSLIPHHKIWQFCGILEIDPGEFLAPPTKEELARIKPEPERRTA